LKNDVKIIQDHLVERRLPIEQKELQSIAQNVIENLVNSERKFDEQNDFELLNNLVCSQRN